MTEQDSALISAFMDGEPVSAEALGRVLADPEARELLVAFVRLREAARQADDPLPASLGSVRRRRSWIASATVPLPAAAASVLAVILASLLLIGPWRTSEPAGPPLPTQALKFEVGVDWQPIP